MGKNVAVLAEIKEGKAEGITYQMLSKAREVAERLGGEVTIIVLGQDVETQAAQLSELGADEVILAEHAALQYHNPELYANTIQLALGKSDPVLLMLGHTYRGIEAASILAEKLKASLATNCMDITVEKEIFKVVRPACYGKLRVDADIKPSPLTIVTIQSGALKVGEFPPRIARLKRINIEEKLVSCARLRFLDVIAPSLEDVDISKGEIIVTVGRGIQSKDNLKLAEELAAVLGGILACTRPIADLGWLPDTRVVGTSGKTVKPKIYLALGMSGALQHIVGMKESEVIVAVNKDPKAPIFNYAHYGIVDDMFKILPVLIEDAKSLRRKTTG